jgi:hypothetical protein
MGENFHRLSLFKAARLTASCEFALAMSMKQRRRWKVTQYTQLVLKSQARVLKDGRKIKRQLPPYLLFFVAYIPHPPLM